MARCANCSKFILGGKKQGDLRYCNDQCYQEGFLAVVADRGAPEEVSARVESIRNQSCAVCGGDGPVDVCTSHTAWSLFVVTSWKDHPRLFVREVRSEGDLERTRVYVGIWLVGLSVWIGRNAEAAFQRRQIAGEVAALRWTVERTPANGQASSRERVAG